MPDHLEPEIQAAYQNNQDFAKTLAGLRESFHPVGTLENLVLVQMAGLQWSLHRVAAHETCYLAAYNAPESHLEPDPLGRRLARVVSSRRAQPILTAFAAREATLNRLYRRALQQLRQAQARRTS